MNDLSPRDLGPLPSWNLDDLYPGTEAPQLAQDLAHSEASAQAFQERYAGHLAELDGDGLAAAITAFEALDETLSRLEGIIPALEPAHQATSSDTSIDRISARRPRASFFVRRGSSPSIARASRSL